MRVHLFLAIIAAGLSASAHADWPALFSGPDNQLDIPTKIAVDGEGNVVICGYFFQGANSDFLTLKYNPLGNLLWSRTFGPAESQESANALAIDSAGNIYVTGTGKGATDNDIFTVKYTPNGLQKWAHAFAGPGASYDSPAAISTTAKGKVVVTGTGIVGSDTNILSAQYSSSGTLEWSAAYSSAGDHSENVDALAVDPSGNVFVAGRLFGDGTDFGLIKYNRLGTQAWVRTVQGGQSGGFDAARAIAVDSEGNVIAFGSLQGSNGLSDFFTLKLSPQGQELWRAKDGTAGSDELGSVMRVDAVNNVVVSGQKEVPNGYDILTIKYDSAGAKLWSKEYEATGGASSSTAAKGLEVTTDGTIFVGVQLGLPDFTSRFAMIKYSPAGKRISVKVNGLTDTNSSTPYAMAIDPASGKTFLTGTAYNPDSVSYDIYTVRY